MCVCVRECVCALLSKTNDKQTCQTDVDFVVKSHLPGEVPRKMFNVLMTQMLQTIIVLDVFLSSH